MISICAVLHWGKHNQFAFERKAVYLLLGNLSLPQRENSIRSKIPLLGSERDDVCPLLGIHLGREQVALLSAALILPGLWAWPLNMISV